MTCPPRKGRVRATVAIAVGALALSIAQAPLAGADHTPTPSSVTLVGALQSELGCPGDWQPDCAASQLQPVAGSPGIYAATFDVPAGAYEYKVALNGTWGENYGAGGAPGGANLPLRSSGGPVTFTYDHSSHVVTDDLPDPITTNSSAQWLRGDLIAWDLPEERDGFSYRLYWAAEGGLALAEGTVTGGSSAPLTLGRGELPAQVRRDLPHLASYEGLRVPQQVRRELDTILTGQVAVASFDASGSLQAVTGVQLAQVLDEKYGARAAKRELGLTWHGSTPELSVWAPTAKSVAVLIDPAGAGAEERVPMSRDRDGVWTVKGKPKQGPALRTAPGTSSRV